MPGIDPTLSTSDALWREIKRLEQELKGELPPGYVTKLWSAGDISRMAQEFAKADADADATRVDGHGPCLPHKVQRTTYHLANCRDLKYALFGRIAMRTVGMDDKLAMLYRRAIVMDQLDDEDKKMSK